VGDPGLHEHLGRRLQRAGAAEVGGVEADGFSLTGALSADGSVVAFSLNATNLAQVTPMV